MNRKYTTFLKKQPTRVKFDGEFIKMGNGIMVWYMPGRAKKSIRAHIEKTLAKSGKKHSIWDFGKRDLGSQARFVMDRMIKEGRLEFVKD